MYYITFLTYHFIITEIAFRVAKVLTEVLHSSILVVIYFPISNNFERDFKLQNLVIHVKYFSRFFLTYRSYYTSEKEAYFD